MGRHNVYCWETSNKERKILDLATIVEPVTGVKSTLIFNYSYMLWNMTTARFDELGNKLVLWRNSKMQSDEFHLTFYKDSIEKEPILVQRWSEKCHRSSIAISNIEVGPSALETSSHFTQFFKFHYLIIEFGLLSETVIEWKEHRGENDFFPLFTRLGSDQKVRSNSSKKTEVLKNKNYYLSETAQHGADLDPNYAFNPSQ